MDSTGARPQVVGGSPRLHGLQLRQNGDGDVLRGAPPDIEADRRVQALVRRWRIWLSELGQDACRTMARSQLRIPRDREHGFQGMVNSKSTAT